MASKVASALEGSAIKSKLKGTFDQKLYAPFAKTKNQKQIETEQKIKMQSGGSNCLPYPWGVENAEVRLPGFQPKNCDSRPFDPRLSKVLAASSVKYLASNFHAFHALSQVWSHLSVLDANSRPSSLKSSTAYGHRTWPGLEDLKDRKINPFSLLKLL